MVEVHETAYKNVSVQFIFTRAHFVLFGSLNVGSSSFNMAALDGPICGLAPRSPCMKTQLSVTTLALAIVAGAVLVTTSSANPEHVAAFRATKKCPGCDLKNAQLGGFQ